jgi:hypothetical protein
MKHYFFSYCFSTGYGNGIVTFPKVTLKNFEKFVEHIKITTTEKNIVILSYQEIK